MKIAILYELLGRSRGGIEAWIYHASEELLKQGHFVTIYNVQECTPNDAAPEGVIIHSLKRPKRIRGFDFFNQIFSLKKQLKNVLHNYDAVWARSFTMAYAASDILGKNKVVYINAAPYSFYGQISFLKRLKINPGLLGFLQSSSSEISIRSAWLLEKQAIINCLNVYLSVARQNETLSFFRIKYDQNHHFVIPAGVNSNRFCPSNSIWKGEAPLKLITVCRLAPDKNVQCVINAIALLLQDNISIQLTIVGEGHYETSLQSITNSLNLNHVISFVGRQEKVEDWYRKNHVFVLPSLYEGFGSVYIEAMACGLPCIAVSNKGGRYSVAADEIIEHEKNGFLMKENNPQELANYLKRYYNKSDEWKICSNAARAKVEEKYKWEKVVLEILKLSKCNS